MESHYEQIISHLNKIIEEKDKIIKAKDLYIDQLKEELAQLKNNQNTSKNENCNTNISSIPNSTINCLSNPPSYIKKDENSLFCMLIMNDKRIAVGGRRGELIIYNSKNLNKDITIDEHNQCWIVHLFQLKNGNLVSTAYNGYEIIQKINFSEYVSQTIELQNLQIVTFIYQETKLKLYAINNNIYNLDCEIDLKSRIRHIIEVKKNELAAIKEDGILDIIDIEKRYVKKNIKEIKFTVNDCSDILCMLTNNILAVGGNSVITLVDINGYFKITEINIENSGQIYSILKFTDNIQWTFDEESQKLNKTSFFKDKVHSSIIRYCLKIDNNSFATCSDDCYLKIWKI